MKAAGPEDTPFKTLNIVNVFTLFKTRYPDTAAPLHTVSDRRVREYEFRNWWKPDSGNILLVKYKNPGPGNPEYCLRNTEFH